MAKEKLNLVFDAEVQANVDNIKATINGLKRQLDKLKIPASASRGFERSLQSLSNELVNFEAIAEHGVESLSDTKKAEASWAKISNLLGRITYQIRDLKESPEQIFSKETAANIEAANKALEAYQKKMDSIKRTQLYKDKMKSKTDAARNLSSAESTATAQSRKVDDQRARLEEAERTWANERAANFEQQKRDLAEVSSLIAQQTRIIEDQKKAQATLNDQEVVTKEGELQKTFKKALARARTEVAEKEVALEIAKETQQVAAETEKAAKKKKTTAKSQLNKAKKELKEDDPAIIQKTEEKTQAENEYAEAQNRTAEAIVAVQEAERALEEIRQRKAQLEEKANQAEGAKQQIAQAQERKKELVEEQAALKAAVQENETFQKQIEKQGNSLAQQEQLLNRYNTSVDQAREALNLVNQELSSMELTGTEEEVRQIVTAFGSFAATTTDISAIGRDTEALRAILDSYKVDSLRAIPLAFEAMGRSAATTAEPVRAVGEMIEATSETARGITRAAEETERLKDSILEFFSISNTIQIFKDAIRDAFNTVKELDAAMTETAVVTDASIGDMWNRLPRYTQAANDLGTTTLGAYETMTLFYQQGLKTDEVFEIGTETMKMARIAGLDYADATNKMTAALRGFNMELDETSARRVNDVYSELAAITAADTEEIANAMTKTASIAHNANMEFETTAAFLSQIIETTRESAETAGTAMKTVIARFQELKKDPSLIGEVDGEVVDANKIESALRTVGVALRDSSGQFRDLDDVFLELASKWKDMDKNTQRYIATVAAGSRQQSRFIAMMSDYDRTMELVNAANESAGASQKQFEKTVDSLESKLNRLSNAWAEYTMGLANNAVIKGAVDALTTLLNVLNDITSWAGNEGLGGIITGFNKLALTIVALRGGGALADTFFGHFSMLNENTKGLYKFANGLEAMKLTAKDIPGMFASLGEKASVFKTKIVDAFTAAKSAFSTGSLLKYIGVIGGVVAALAAVVAIYKAIKENSPEAQLERAAKLTEEASGAAKEAAQSYNDLKESLESIEDGTSSLEALTRGTQEWKEAVQDTNQQILELIEKYPALAAFVESNGGILTINEQKTNAQGQRAQDIENEYYLKKIQAAGVEAIAKAEEIRVQSSFEFQDLQADAKVYTVGSVSQIEYGGQTRRTVSKEATEQLALALASGEAAPNKEGVTAWLAKEGYSNFDTTSLDINALIEFGQGLRAAKEAMSVFTQSLTTSVLAQMDATEETAKAMGSFMTDDRVNAIYNSALSEVKVNKQSKQELADIMGWDYNRGKFYAGEGEDRHEIEGMTDEYFKKLYASVIAQQNITTSLEGFSQAMGNWGRTLDTDTYSAISAAYGSSHGEQLTKRDLELLDSLDINSIYEQAGGEEALGSYDQFIADFNLFKQEATMRFEEVQNVFADLGADLRSLTFDDNLTSGAIEGLSRGLEQVYNETGASGVRTITTMLQEMTEGLDATEVEQFASSLNAVNWTDVDAVEGLKSSFKNFGVEVNGGEAAINSLIEAIIKLSGATRNWDLETLTERIDQTSQLISDISAGEREDRIFSAEEAEILRGASPGIELTRTGEDSYVYAGDNLKELTNLLNQYVSNLITSTPAFENATQEQKTDMLTTAYSGMSGFDMLNIVPGDEAQEKAIANTMEARVAQENLQKQVEEATIAIAEENKEFAKNEKAVGALVLDANEASKATEKLCKTVEDNSEAFKEGNRQLANGGKVSDSYYKVLSQIASEAKGVFGDIATEDFVQANAEAFEQLAEGGAVGAAAFERIQAAARQATLSALESDERIAGVLTDIQNWVAQADLDFSVNGYANITDIVNKLLTVGYTIEETKALLESLLGATVNFKVEYQKMVLPRAAYEAMYKGQAGVTAKDINGMMYEVSIPKAITTSGGATAKKKSYRNSGYSPSGSGGGGSSGSSKEEDWENPYDKLYNLTREINEELRERERLERRYQQLLKEHHTGAQDIAAISEKELAHLQEEVELQQALIAGRKEQLEEYMADNANLSKYAGIETNERGEQVLRIDWEAINKITDADKGQEVEDHISQLEEWMDSLEEAQDSLQEIEDAVQEIKERGKDEYFNLEDRIKEAVTQFYQAEIDNLAAINDSINSTNERLVDAIQSSVDKMRQDRENAETEEEIADKQRKLAYLQQDTSGANDLAILQLQDEIEQAQQDYTDTLIDQKISELQEQNDKAAEQRQQQIELAQAQLDHYIESGEIWQEVYDLMGSGLNEETGLIRGSKLEEILKSSETFSGLSEIGQMEWLKELNANVASALAYLKVGRQLEDLGFAEGAEITFTTSDGKTLKGKMDKSGNVTVDGKTYSDVYQGYDGNFYSEEEYENKKASQKPTDTKPPKESTTVSEQEEWKPSVGSFVKIQKDARFVSGEKVLEAVRAEGVISGKKGAFKILRDQGDGNFYVGKEWSRNGVTGLINKKYLTKYKTGGLADFTGPAWLDGTKSKPEMVLNARDTQNFIQLKDILSNILSRTSGSSTTENNGDYTYDIDINVEKIGSDYDLDRIASKVRSMITDASQYRNNNAIGLKR